MVVMPQYTLRNMDSIVKEVSIEPGRVTLNNAEVFKTETTEVGPFLKALYQKSELKYSKFFKMDYLCKLGFMACEILLENEEIENDSDDVALVFANASASLNTDVKYQKTIADIASPAVFVYTLPNIVIGEVSIRHKFYGEHMFFVQKEYNKEVLLSYTNVLFQSTNTKHALVGWIDVDDNNNYSAKVMLCKK